MRTKKALCIYTITLVLCAVVVTTIIGNSVSAKASQVKQTKDLNLNVEHQISIMCQNLRREYTTKDGVGNNTILRYRRIVNQFDRYDSDILCFQECNKAWQWLLDYKFKDEDYHKVVYYNNNGLATPVYAKKSKFDLMASNYYLLSNKSSETNDENRIACWAKLRDKNTGKTFGIYSGHFAFDSNIQITSCEGVKAHAQTINVDAYVICGDFNFSMKTNGTAYNIMNRNGTKDLAVAAATEGIQGITGGTFHNYGKETQPKRIDFFFGTENIRTKMYTVINDVYDDKYVSDHHGILTYIDIN